MADQEKIKALETQLQKLQEAERQTLNIRIQADNIKKLIEAEKKK